MKQQELDYILTTMLKAYDNVSDLNFTVDKPCQVEASGELKSVTLPPLPKKLTAFRTEAMALNLIDGDHRLIRNLVDQGSCDISYQLAGKARFRVNIFSQRGCYSIVMRLLSTRVPTVKEMNLPGAFLQDGP